MRRQCAECSEDMPIGMRRTSTYCNGTCRVRAHRRRHRETVPAELRAADRWVRRHGKRPITITGRPASSTASSTWSSYAEVSASTIGTGLGFMLGNGIGCIDIDHCVSADGTISELAQRVLDLNPDAWVELSLSGTGLHAWGLMDERPGRVRDGLEIYSRARFIALGTTYRTGGLYPLIVPELVA